MYEATRNVLGLMSGTSLDGMDAALVRFEIQDSSGFELLEYHHFPYPPDLKKLVQRCFHDERILVEVDEKFAQWTIDVIKKVQNLSTHHFDLVGTHGQTIFHEPDKKRTVQAGNLPMIAKATGCSVVANFRTQDVLLGGQGAPLVPFGDHKLFGEYEAALNLGGFANVSVGKPQLKNGIEVAFDICPVNIVLNVFAEELGYEYDAGGEQARRGTINQWVLEELNSLEYYDRSAPKSLGSEWVEAQFLPLVDYLRPQDALATVCEHVAEQIFEVLGSKKTLITGGGAFNNYLMQRIELLGGNIYIPEKQIIEAKEAIIFALLAHERDQGRVNVLGHTTGSGITHSSGVIFRP